MIEQYELFRGGVREFVNQEILNRAQVLDQKQDIPSDLILKLAKQGYLGAAIKKKFGGTELNPFEMCALHEEIARGHGSVENMLTVTGMFSVPLQRFGTIEQKTHWLPAIASGKCIGAVALTEPHRGSDLRHVETEAKFENDSIILSGSKKWITLGQIADVFLVLANCDNKTVAVLVERHTPGLTITPINNMLGLKANMLAQLDFNECRIPSSNIVGKAIDGIATAIEFALDEGRFTTACGSLGLTQAAFDICKEYVNRREQFGRPLVNHQLVQKLITEMLVGLKTSRLLCLNAAQKRMNLDADMLGETLVAKYHASLTAKSVTDRAVQLLGASGCHDSAHVERYFRDAKIMEIIEGTTQIHELQISRISVI